MTTEISNDELLDILKYTIYHHANGDVSYHDADGDLHRDEGAAYISASGTQYWYQHGKVHRDNDEPAAVYSNGTKRWFQHGKEHRATGLPAVIYASGEEEFFENGVQIFPKT